MGEEGHVMLLLAVDLGCDLRVGRTFRTLQRRFGRQGLALRQGSHDTHDVTWPRCNSLGHRPENSCCGGRKVRRTAMSSSGSEDSASSAM